MEKFITQPFGTLIKTEPLSCIESDLLMRDTCVLESVSPFYGYYDGVQTGAKPFYIYLMLDEPYTFDEIYNAIWAVHKKTDIGFDAVKAYISFSDIRLTHAIRLRKLERYDQIARLQQSFTDEGLRLRRKSRDFENLPGLIQLEKFFYLEDLGEGIYADKSVDHHGYFEVPSHTMDWIEFKKIIKEVKFDTNLLFFDAAMVRFFNGIEVTNLIRIYKENIDRQHLEAIKMRYLHVIGN